MLFFLVKIFLGECFLWGSKPFFEFPFMSMGKADLRDWLFFCFLVSSAVAEWIKPKILSVSAHEGPAPSKNNSNTWLERLERKKLTSRGLILIERWWSYSKRGSGCPGKKKTKARRIVSLAKQLGLDVPRLHSTEETTCELRFKYDRESLPSSGTRDHKWREKRRQSQNGPGNLNSAFFSDFILDFCFNPVVALVLQFLYVYNMFHVILQILITFFFFYYNYFHRAVRAYDSCHFI